MDEATKKECVRERVLAAAMKIFAEKGYRDTTISDICTEAQANGASVNYYFGSKDNLYGEIWKEAFEVQIRAYPPDGGLPEEAPAEAKLRALISSHVRRMLDPLSSGVAGMILIREMVQPTEHLTPIRNTVLEPLKKRSERIIRDLLGPYASDKQVLLCCLSIIHQCLAFGARRISKGFPPFMDDLMQEPEIISDLADHIYQFSLGGILALRVKMENTPV